MRKVGMVLCLSLVLAAAYVVSGGVQAEYAVSDDESPAWETSATDSPLGPVPAVMHLGLDADERQYGTDGNNGTDAPRGNSGNDNPGNSGDDAPGNSGDAGNNGDGNPGNGGEGAPGNSGDDAPGNSGDDAPGNSGDDAPGNSGDAGPPDDDDRGGGGDNEGVSGGADDGDDSLADEPGDDPGSDGDEQEQDSQIGPEDSETDEQGEQELETESDLEETESEPEESEDEQRTGQDDGERSDGEDHAGDDGDDAADSDDSDVGDVTAQSPGAVNISSVQPQFETSLEAFSDTAITAGERVQITLDVENTGLQAGTFDADLRVDGETVSTESVDIGARETETIVFDHRFDEPGEYEIAVGETVLDTLTVTPADDSSLTTSSADDVDSVDPTAAVDVVEATALSDWVREGSETTVRATVVNTANQTVTRTLSVTVNGQPVANESVTLQPSERRVVYIDFQAVGGDVAVEGVDAGVLDVSDRLWTGAIDPTDDRDDVGSGFALTFLVAAIAGLAGILALDVHEFR